MPRPYSDGKNMNIQKKLAELFDYQKFERNPQLDELITQTQSRYGGVPLEDEALGLVNAAGEPQSMRKKGDWDDGDK